METYYTDYYSAGSLSRGTLVCPPGDVFQQRISGLAEDASVSILHTGKTIQNI